MRTLIDENRIQVRISEMATEIDAYYQRQNWYKNTQEPVIVIGVLTGAVFFMTDLVKKLSIRTELDFIRTSTYPGKTTTALEPEIIMPPIRPLHCTNILLVDDILDTGKTIQLIRKYLAHSYPESIQTAVLLCKPEKVIDDIAADFVGFNIPDEFVIGYGLDYNGRFRGMPHVAVWSENECETSKSYADKH